MRILLVDDDIDILSELREWLAEIGHMVEAVYSGPEALEHLSFYQYDLIIMDHNLPGKEGNDVCREFRSTGGITPVVIMSGNNPEDILSDCLKCGANLVLEKPYPLDQIEDLVNRFAKTGHPVVTYPKEEVVA